MSIGDSIAGLYAAFGVMAALWQRDREGGDRQGRTIDVALTEAVLSMMEGLLPEYSALGVVRQPSGSRIPTAAPTNAYRTADGKWIVIAANSDHLFAQLAATIGYPELRYDHRFRNNQLRVENAVELDRIINGWTVRHLGTYIRDVLSAADIPCTPIYTAADICEDPQFRHRGMVVEIEDPCLGKVLHPGIVPRMVDSPGAVRWSGPAPGAHTAEVLSELLKMAQPQIRALREEGVIG